jgi:hypothetical protein
MGSYFDGGSPSNYTIGGTRFWFNRNVDLTLTPPRREGFKDLGNIVEASPEQTVDILDHFSARSGTRKKDRSLVREISEDVLLTLDEWSLENLREFMRAGTVTDVAAAAAVAVTDYVAQLNRTDVVVITVPAGGYAPATIVVKDITAATTYVLNTDYELVDIIGGFKGVKRKAGGAILTGDFVRINFTYDQRATERFSPGTVTEIIGQAMFFGVSDTGNEFIRSFERVQLEPEGALTIQDDDWSSFQIRMKILDNSEAVPTAPFGLFDHYGKGTNL